jgi:hypothetical protein
VRAAAATESAVHGREVDDPDEFVSAVNAVARRHGISQPMVEASAWTVRATTPPDLLVGAMLSRLHKQAEQSKLGQLACFLATLDPDESALLRHRAGLDIADEATLRRLDPAGDLVNDQAHRSGLADAYGLPLLLRRDDQGQWRLHATLRAHLRDLWRPGKQ